MKKINNYILLVALTVGCAEKNDNIADIRLVDGGTAESNFICELDENMKFLNAQISNVEFMNDSTFVVSNNNQVCIYNTDGSQIKILDKTGRALGEFGSAGAIDVVEDNIYVWCTASLKLLKYDCNGKFISQYDGFKKSITSFNVLGDNVYFYGIGNRKLFNLYNLKDQNIIDDYEERSDANEILQMYGMMSCVSNMDNGVVYVDPSTMIVYFIESTTKKELFRINDKNYITQVDVSVADVMKPPYDKALEYITDNSTILGVHTYNDNIYIVAENPNNSSKNELVKRNLVVYVVSADRKEARSIKFNYPEDSHIKRVCFNKNDIYFLSVSSSEGGVSLNKIVY